MFRFKSIYNNNNLVKVYNNNISSIGSIINSGSISISSGSSGSISNGSSGSISNGSSGSISNSGFNNFRFIISTSLNKITNSSKDTTTNSSNDTTINSSKDTTTDSSAVYVPKFKLRFNPSIKQDFKAIIKNFCEGKFKKNQNLSEEDIQMFIKKYQGMTTVDIRHLIRVYSNIYFKSSYMYNKNNLKNNLTNYVNIKPTYTVIPLEKQRAIVSDFLQKRFNSQDLDYFYDIDYKEFISYRECHTLFYYYGGSIVRIAYGAFPEHPWIFNMFKSRSLGRVEDNNYERQIKLFAKKNNIRTAEDWYNIKMKDLQKFIKYPRSKGLCYLPIYVKNHFPELKIKAFLMDSFHFLSLRRANDNGELDLHLQDFVEYINKKLELEYVEQYYLLTDLDVKKVKGTPFLSFFGSRFELFKALYPDFKWDPIYFSPAKVQTGRTKLINRSVNLFNLESN